MCIGDAALDTIGPGEQEHLRAAAQETFPKHRFGVRANDEGTNWVVLEPPVLQAHLLRFTICRIAPCIVVMAEDPFGRRQFCSTEGLDDAIAFAHRASEQAVLAAMNAHPVHTTLQ